MIQIVFEYIGDKVLVHIDGKNITFGNSSWGSKMTPIDGLRLDYAGVCREFPDLESNKDWRNIAISRFKEKISQMSSEKEISDYIINDLKKFGYIPISIQEKGMRIKKL